MPTDERIQLFRISIEDAELADLRDRLARTRFPAQLAGTGWQRGVPVDYLDGLARYWASGYDWRAREAKLNRQPQFTTEIDGQTIHFVHVVSPEANATPLLLLHGYPGSIVDFIELIGPLADPRGHGADASAPAFHVVIPSLPGFGFSTPVTETGWDSGRAARAFTVLMARLGYDRYVAHGYDVGGGIAGDLAKHAPDAVIGVHVATDPAALAYLGMLPEPGDDTPAAERASLERLRAAAESGTGYLKLQSTRPATVAVGLNDSPAFQLAWIVEKVREWTNPERELPEDAIDRDTILDNVSLYWFTGSGASAAQFIYESMNADRDWSPGPPIPTAFSVFDTDPVVRAAFDPDQANPHWFEHREGGHFPSLEMPDLLLADLRSFVGAITA